MPMQNIGHLQNYGTRYKTIVPQIKNYDLNGITMQQTVVKEHVTTFNKNKCLVEVNWVRDG